MSLYKELLLDHYKNPRQKGEVANFTFKISEANPLCGDVIQITGLVEQRVLKQVAFLGQGCVISQATTSILLEKYLGCLVDNILACEVQNLLDLIQMQLGPNRLKCALLPLAALQNGLKSC